jgi:hypothetical protein
MLAFQADNMDIVLSLPGFAFVYLSISVHNPSFKWLPTTAPIFTTHARSPASLGLRRAPHSISPPSPNAQSLRRARFERASPGAIGRPIDRQGRNDQKSPFSDICVWRGRGRVGRQCLIPATQAW